MVGESKEAKQLLQRLNTLPVGALVEYHEEVQALLKKVESAKADHSTEQRVRKARATTCAHCGVPAQTAAACILLGLPAALLRYFWPAERGVVGLRVCNLVQTAQEGFAYSLRQHPPCETG